MMADGSCGKVLSDRTSLQQLSPIVNRSNLEGHRQLGWPQNGDKGLKVASDMEKVPSEMQERNF